MHLKPQQKYAQYHFVLHYEVIVQTETCLAAGVQQYHVWYDPSTVVVLHLSKMQNFLALNKITIHNENYFKVTKNIQRTCTLTGFEISSCPVVLDNKNHKQGNEFVQGGCPSDNPICQGISS